jgi:hypothetical protein
MPSTHIIRILGLATVLAGCESRSPNQIVSPALNVSVATGSAGPAASGHANVTQAPGILRTFSFHGRQQPDGLVHGTYVNHNRLADVVNQGDIDCLRLIGSNGAVLSGPARRHTVPGNVGFISLFRIEDNGEGETDAPDRISGLFGFAPTAGVNCQTFTPPTETLRPIEGGNIQVMP